MNNNYSSTQQLIQKMVGAYLTLFQLITNAVNSLLHTIIYSTVGKDRSGKILEWKILFLFIIIYYVLFFSYANFHRSQKHNCYEVY